MKKLIFLLLILFSLKLFSQNENHDTLYPYEILKNNIESFSTVIFDNTNIAFEVSHEDYIATIKTAIQKKSPVIISYSDTLNYIISSVKLLKVDPKEKFLEKYDVLSYNNFVYKERKSFNKNEKIFLKELALTLPILKKEIPIDSLSIIFNYFISQSCENLPTCSKVNPCISFDYKTDGCYARAHWMKKILEDKFGYDCQKIFVTGILKAINGGI